MEVPQRGPGAEPLMEVRGQSPRNGGLGAEPPEAEQVLMIIKNILAEILLIKCCIYNIIRSIPYLPLVYHIPAISRPIW